MSPLVFSPTGQGVGTPVGSGASSRAELLQVVSAPGGSVLLDLADGVNFSYQPDTLTIDPSGQQGGSSTGLTLDQGAGYVTVSDERYGGSTVDYDRRPNGVLSWRAIIMQTTTQTIAQAVQTLLAEVERADPPGTRYIAWQRYTATTPLYYERRGPGAWTVVERWETGEIAQIDISLPVAPVAYGPPTTTALAAQALPATWALPAPGGTLPALMDVTTQTASMLRWAVLGAYQGAPVGLYNATAGGFSGGWTSVADSAAFGGTKLSTGSPTASTFYQAWANIDASTMALDTGEYENDVALEVWIRARWNPALISPLTGIAFAQPSDATLRVYTLEYGAAGKVLANVGPPPSPPQPTGSSLSTGGTLPGGTTYFPVCTYLNARGESHNGPQGSVAIPTGTNTNRLTITSPPAAGSGIWAATTYNTYIWNGSTWILQPGGPTLIGNTQFFSSVVTSGTSVNTVDTTFPWQLFRLGTVRIPPQAGWQIVVDLLTPSTIPSGSILSLDYMLVTPARWRASSPTGIPADASYPPFAPVASTWIKRISNRLSATGGASSGAQHLDTGLGGSPLRCPNSSAPQLVAHASPSVPDDPSANSPEDLIGVSLTPTVTLTPRYRLLDAS